MLPSLTAFFSQTKGKGCCNIQATPCTQMQSLIRRDESDGNKVEVSPMKVQYLSNSSKCPLAKDSKGPVLYHCREVGQDQALNSPTRKHVISTASNTRDTSQHFFAVRLPLYSTLLDASTRENCKSTREGNVKVTQTTRTL